MSPDAAPIGNYAAVVIYRQAIVWQKAMRLAAAVCRESARMRPRERFVIGTQLSRAAISVVSNIAEGWARESPREKANFLSIAQGSLDELQTQLALCDELLWVDAQAVRGMLASADEIGRILTTLRKRFRRNGRNQFPVPRP